MPSAAELLAWYDRHRRILPWRAGPGEARDPYRVWLSEVMLQQTTVATVGPRYARFLARFPTVTALAAADWAEVAEEWAGLGYYARARNLHACAKAVAMRGSFPRDAAGLQDLPGIGRYTAAAVGAIAFDEPVLPVDGNVERVIARLKAVEEPLPGSKPRLVALAEGFMHDPAARARPGDFAQALFDLGATICTPRSPACGLCPWRGGCAAQRAGIAADLPRKTPKAARPLRHGVHFLLTDHEGRILLRRRPAKGLLGGMLEVPGTPWRDAPWEGEAMAHAPAIARWQRVPGIARHGFTHFQLEMVLYAAAVGPAVAPEGEWLAPAAARAAVPTVMRRLLELMEAVA
ncbi:A/G-specific adenine glycosylase [Roseomonas sp. HJA6]|uniref:Adenine DNA glycosylase n=1 Tax=Roseomonas alba TaxID=2846776 RepID=A0ABS7A2V4_9PROT|nr:A/G-specific adenine glycosylase [Neoroseomonas alba]MBW6396614.1 A/G-specific adenine glycosylase [Neoroseomonas alba]